MKKDSFTFGSIFSKSFHEYKENFREIFKLIFIFLGIPALIFCLIKIALIIVNPSLFSLVLNPSLIQQAGNKTAKLPLYYQLISWSFSLITAFLTVFVSAGLISTSLKKSKFSFREMINNAKPRYWKFFLFGLVTMIFILLLCLLLIIPGIIFAVYWAFAAYIFFDKKEKILPSLKQSKKLVKDRWWKTFGYGLLMFLILGGFCLVIMIIELPTLLIYTVHILNGTSVSYTFFVIYSLISTIAGFLTSLVCYPLGVLFFKNYYLELRQGPERRSK